MKKNLFLIHKWLALVFSLPLLVMAITGLIMSFSPKNPPARVATPASVADTVEITKIRYPELNFVRLIYNPSTITLMARDKAETKLITVDRGTTKILKEINPKEDPFIFSKIVHESFLLQGFGKKLVAFSGLALTLILLSGTFFWIRKSFFKDVKRLYRIDNLSRLKGFHIALGLTLFLPLLFASVTGFMIEFNSAFFQNAVARPHEKPMACTWPQQVSLLYKLRVTGRGNIFFCRPDHPYLMWNDERGTHQLAPNGEEVLFVEKNDWRKLPGTRKHFFVHWHGGENFGFMELPYLWANSLSLGLLIVSGFLMWLKKKRQFRA